MTINLKDENLINVTGGKRYYKVSGKSVAMGAGLFTGGFELGYKIGKAMRRK
ncbi:hypothetical protein [Fructobacillus durionis]|uniref:Uncharacterized protein n=1 Tax=Fructobacillus durionis TaxID=283737 RepID=A0A1I1F3W8_9LACO|nr:hypothetical protein [Fructobacillus durionis]SFB93967.1 hypothetical protein SAMN05660453_0660 [Fructobacillus durionis]